MLSTIALAIFLAMAAAAEAETALNLRIKKSGFVSLNVYRPDGTLVRQLLTGDKMPAGIHAIRVDEKDPLPSGEYTWRAVIHDGLAFKTRGWLGDWGGNQGVPSAATADNSQVYLGWSRSTADACTVLACTPEGTVRWSHHRGKLSGCHALAVDDKMLYILGGEGDDGEGGSIYRLAVKDGSLLRWPDGRIDLKITSLWPSDGKPKPCLADFFSVKNGRIYLSFSRDEFAAVLDAKTGAYLQTIVGAPPGAIDSAATLSDTPENPNSIVDADFVVTALKGGAIGKILLIHDPLWVIASDLTPLERNERITALTFLGDKAKHHRHDIFVAMGYPFNQVQARSALNTDTCSYLAGQKGGRPAHGSWQPESLGSIRALALDSTGQLWIAEGSSSPRRVSVWTTDSAKGKLVREFFSPPECGSPIAIAPTDPGLMYADGCEWRIDPISGRGVCLGVITQESVRSARFIASGKEGLMLVLKPFSGPDLVFQRIGDGEYRPYSEPLPDESSARFRLSKSADGSWNLTTADEFRLGGLLELLQSAFKGQQVQSQTNHGPIPPEMLGSPTLTQTVDGRFFLTAGAARIWNLELSGLETVRPLQEGQITIP